MREGLVSVSIWWEGLVSAGFGSFQVVSAGFGSFRFLVITVIACQNITQYFCLCLHASLRLRDARSRDQLTRLMFWDIEKKGSEKKNFE